MAHVDGRQDVDRNDAQEDPVVRDVTHLPAWIGPDGTVAVSLSARAYSQRTIFAAAYKLADRCGVWVDTEGDDRWVLFLVGLDPSLRQTLITSLLNELVDQTLREQLDREFGAVRTLIVAQAFAEGNLLDPDVDQS